VSAETEIASRCSRCGSPAVIPIVYGLPGGALIDAAGRGEIVLGGCIVGPQKWACLECAYWWPLPPEALESPIVCNALYLAHRAYRDQEQVEHAIEVAHELFEGGYEPFVVAAGLLHEALGSGVLSADQIADEAGAPAADLVEAMTERAEICERDRRGVELRARLARMGGRPLALYAADRLCTLRRAERKGSDQHQTGALAAELWNLERDIRMLTQLGMPPFLFALDDPADSAS